MSDAAAGRLPSMVIVSGHLEVDPAHRDAYVDGCREVVVAARAAAGCLDFHITADPLEPGRVNVYEQWESVAAVEAFRGDGPSEEQATEVLSAAVDQHEVASSTRL
jgi:quinol monooxygenase YgiN